VTSDARVRPPEEDTVAEDTAVVAPAARDGADDVREPAADTGDRRSGSRLSLPVVPVLATLLVLLAAAAAFLWFTRPEPSAIGTADYVEVLQAARSGVKDLTSFDHLTLDDDIEQIRRVTTGDLREESVAELEDNRQQIEESEAIVNTEVIGAGVLEADEDSATVMMVIQATQESTASPQAQVSSYRIQVELTKENERWLLSGITGR
jgi:Mce-associated membrane protein